MTDTILKRRVDESDFRYEVRLCVAKLDKELDLNWEEIRDHLKLDCSADHLRKISYGYRKMVDNEVLENEPIERVDSSETLPDYKEDIEIMNDGSHKSNKLLKMSNEQSKDTSHLLKAHGYDDSWEVVNAKSSIWNQSNKNDGMLTLYSSKITVKPKVYEFTQEEIREFFTDLSKTYKSPVHKPTRYKLNGKMLELNIADLHVGKLCWSGDTGDTYDEVKAEESFFYIINDVLNRTKQYEFEKILFVWSNDFFHFDGLSKTTTGGTPQDTNLQYSKMYKLGVRMLVQAIDMISKIAPVETFYIASNHDKVTSYHATEYLYAWYRNNENISVDATPISRKYVEFGNSLIQFSHGHSEKKRLGSTMQVDMREAWGRTLYHEVHAAHIHSEKMTTENNGVIIRHISSSTGTDNWHFESGYVGAVKKAQSFLWDKEYGLELIINTPILSK